VDQEAEGLMVADHAPPLYPVDGGAAPLRPVPRFWARADVQRAVVVMNLWATLYRFRNLGGIGDPDFSDFRTEGYYFDVAAHFGRDHLIRTVGKQAALAASREDQIAAAVDYVLHKHGNPAMLRAVLRHRYPSEGPIAPLANERKYRHVRTPIAKAWLKHIGTDFVEYRWPSRALSSFLGSVERAFIDELADLRA